MTRVRCAAFQAAPPGAAVPGLDPATGLLRFVARTGPGSYPLRLSLLYTPLRPGAGLDFTAAAGGGGGPSPSLRAVVSGTEPLGTVPLLGSGDAWAANGTVSFGPMRAVLAVPAGGQPARAGAGGAPLSVPSNRAAPAGLVLDAATDCAGGAVAGNLSWDAMPGWEGLAYRVCVVARPACVPAEVTALPGILAPRCFFVIVPKCQRCFRTGKAGPPPLSPVCVGAQALGAAFRRVAGRRRPSAALA